MQVGDEVLSITNGEFFWSKNGKEPILQDINLKVKKGELIAVLGQVGAGKVCVLSIVLALDECLTAYSKIQTSLLSAITGGMRKTEGKIRVHGTIAYAPQNPWLANSCIAHQNISSLLCAGS